MPEEVVEFGPNPREASRSYSGELIEGGAIAEHGQDIVVKGPFDLEKHRGRMSFCLLLLLGLIIVGHYLGALVMTWNGKNVETLNDAFHVALPTVSGLAGTAIAYYFTRTR